MLSTIRKWGKSLLGGLVSTLKGAVVATAVPTPLKPVVSKTFHDKWMAHFNHTIKTMNRKVY